MAPIRYFFYLPLVLLCSSLAPTSEGKQEEVVQPPDWSFCTVDLPEEHRYPLLGKTLAKHVNDGTLRFWASDEQRFGYYAWIWKNCFNLCETEDVSTSGNNKNKQKKKFVQIERMAANKEQEVKYRKLKSESECVTKEEALNTTTSRAHISHRSTSSIYFPSMGLILTKWAYNLRAWAERNQLKH